MMSHAKLHLASDAETRHAEARGMLNDLQASLANGSLSRRVELLQRVTDLFMHGADQFSDDHISVFDDVFECLVSHMHDDAQIELARRMAPVASAPRRLIRYLAMHDLIEVAAPVLSQSDRLDEETLLEVARSKDQHHLKAIAERSHICGAVTDVLLERGDDEVVGAVASNANADLTDRGHATLISRAEQHDWIFTCLQMRPSMPRHFYLQLVAKASKEVRARLSATYPQSAEAVAEAVDDVSHRVLAASAALQDEIHTSHRLVRLLHEDGRLDDRQVERFARDRKFNELCAALACMARIPLSLAEALMIESQDEGLFILGKVCGLSWHTVCEIVTLRVHLGYRAECDKDAARDSYQQLRISTAQQILRFHRMRLTISEPV
jgi:uncharacterized protein (DUF2336 family)